MQIAQKGGSAMSWEFLTHSTPFSMMRQGGGFLNGLIGTAIMVGLASLVSIPLGILAAVYLVEYGKNRLLANFIRFFSDVMTGVPSIFVGVFVYTALVIKFGYGAIMGAAALALIMMPIVVRSSEEMLKLVPRELKDASYALGAPKWQTITRVVLPSAAPGLTTGAMLAVARAAGETAPLIMTALGSIQLVTKLAGSPISSLPYLIFQQAGQPFDAAQARAWAGALELLVIVLILTIVARIFSSRSRLTR
ncbi:MAG: phosphate ABC transporter permease PstA [Chloroflexi bacterium]|nr:phosphate ABC transporter permease PstA [Chloroflexota bacterium]